MQGELEAALGDAAAALAEVQQAQVQATAAAAAAAESGGAALGPASAPASAPAAALVAATGTTSVPRRTPAGGAAADGNNARIHPRSKYSAEAPDFGALARLYPSLQPYLLAPPPGRRPSFDFASAAACRELTRVLLLHDFGVQWWVPLGQLVPPLTNRANYLHWLEDLLGLSAPPGER